MTGPSRAAAVGFCFCMLTARAAGAQTSRESAPRFEIAVGPAWTARASFGTRGATETAPTGGFLLFSTTSRLTSSTGADARIDVRVRPSLQAEASASYARPALGVDIGSDAEGASSTVARESLQRFTLEGGVVWRLPRWRSKKASPFLSAGLGWLRDLHEGSTLVSDGQSAHAGGGVRWPLVSRSGRLKAAGLRADALVLLRRKGAAIDDRVHASPGGAVSIFVRF